MNLDPFVVEEFENYFILFKPAGWFVHPPEDKRALKAFQNRILTKWLWSQRKTKSFPVHRLDFGTEGLLIWAKSSEAAGVLSELNQSGQIRKFYHAVCRGYVEPEEGTIEIPLDTDSSPDEKASRTDYQTLQRLELKAQINSKFPTSRYSLLEIRLHTGRWHQIRRHFNRISHHLIGDREHGDSHHNRYFRDQLKISGLLLKAYKLEFQDPWGQTLRTFLCPMTPTWEQVHRLFS